MMQLWGNTLFAQINAIVTVVPPFSNKLSDYTSQPNKIAVILTLGAQDRNQLNLNIEGSITSLNGDIQIYTKPGHKPAHPITINRTGNVFLPYQVTYPEIRDVLDANWLMYKGITKQQIMQDGLPEGTYRVCMKVFDYASNAQLSGEACSNTFNVSSVDAPVIIQPMHQSQIKFMPVQSLVFSWIPSAGAPATTQYKIRIVEINNNSTINPNDALRSTGYPKFFETTVTGTTYLYSAANPALTPGKQYAFIVVADDPLGKVKFRNMGASEMHVFTYQQNGQAPSPPPPPPPAPAPPPQAPPANAVTTVKGTLSYKYPGQNNTYPLKNGNIRLVAKYFLVKSDGTVSVHSFGTRWPDKDSYYENGPQDNEEIAPPINTDANGNYEFIFYTNYKMGLVDDDYQCQETITMFDDYQGYENIVRNTLNKDKEINNGWVKYIHPEKFENPLSYINASSGKEGLQSGNVIDLLGNTGSVAGGIIASARGSFAFRGISTGCKLYRYYTIEFLEPQSNYYLNPDKENVDRILAQPGDNVTANIVAPVRTASLSVKVMSTRTGTLTAVSTQPEMMGVQVFLLRKKLNFYANSTFPKDDVTPDKTDDYPLNDPSITNTYNIVGKALSNGNGIAEFQNLVFDDVANYQYYIYATTPIREGQFNYHDVGVLSVAFKLFPITTYTGNSFQAELDKHSAYGCPPKKLNYTITMIPKFPSVYVELFNETRRVTEVAQVLLTEKWDYYNGDKVWYHYMDGPTSNLPNYPNQTNSLTMVRSDTSLYGYDNLDMLIDPEEKFVRGPNRKILIHCPGYRDTTITVTEPIKLGQKKYYQAFLKLGSDVKGVVTDAETNKPLEGVAVRMSYNVNCANTGADGKFNNIPAKLLPGVPQYIIYQKDEYVSDSVEITVNGPHVTAPPMHLYKNYRRLKLHVLDYYSVKPLKGMHVTLPGVMVPKAAQLLDNNQVNIHGVNNAQLAHVQSGSQTTQLQSNNAHFVNAQSGGTQLQSNSQFVNTQSGNHLQNKGNQNLVIYNAANSGLINNSSNSNANEEPLSGITDDNGYVFFAFRSQEDNDMMFEIDVESPESNPGNYVGKPISIKIPNGKETTEKSFPMIKGTCIEGHIYASESNISPVDGVTTKLTIPFYSDKSTITDASGYYKLHNIPVSFKPATLQILKSGIAGDQAEIGITQASDVCLVKDFHMKNYEGIDLNKLLGFTIQPIITEDKVTGVVTMSGDITGLASGNIKATENIPFYGVKFEKDNHTNKWVFSGKEINTTKNYIDVSIYGDFKGRAYDPNGIKVERIETTETGNISGKVRVDSTNFGGMGFTLPSVFLTKSNNTPPGFAVFSSGQTIANINSYYVSNSTGSDIRYTIKGFQDAAVAKAEKSKFNKDGLIMNTTLEANISSIKPSKLNIDVGDIAFKKSGMTFSTTNPLDIGIGNWKFKCNNWAIGNEGLVVNAGVLATGVDIPFENLRITSSMLKTDMIVLHFDKMKLLGIHDLVVTSNHVVLDYTSTWGGVYAWQVYAGPQNGQATVGYIQNLPSLAPGEKIEFSNILLNNQGDNMLQMVGKTFKLHNFINFTPNPGETMQLTNDFFSIRGAYQLNIPYAEMKYGDAVFYKNNNTIAYMPKYVEALDFTHQGVTYKISVTSLTDRLLTAKGTVEEPGNLPALNVTLTSTPSLIKIDIDPGQKIKLGSTNYLDQVTGGINVASHQWQSLKFDGYPKGMAGISESNQKLAFEVTGAVKATGQNINVSEIPSFPGLTLTYDMQNSRLIGYCDLSMDLGGMKLAGGVNTIMDGSGWIFQVDGSMEVPGLGGLNMFGLFGNYNGIPAEFASKFGSAVCLPAGFTQHIKGFFLSAGITKQILPKIDKNFAIVSVKAGLDLSLDARVFMQFGGGGSIYGLGVLARGNAYVIGSCDATCTTLSASASLQAGISGNYTKGVFNVDGCTSLSLNLSASQCFPLVPLTGICGPCFSVSLPSLTLGATMHLDSGGGCTMGITTSSCDQQCH